MNRLPTASAMNSTLFSFLSYHTKEYAPNRSLRHFFPNCLYTMNSISPSGIWSESAVIPNLSISSLRLSKTASAVK